MALVGLAHNLPFISVVIPTCNRPGLLRDAILSVYDQDYPKDRYEIIIVDDGSEDSTASVVSSLRGETPRLSYEKQAHLGAPVARNLGARLARGNILLFTDDDCILARACLSCVARALELNPDAGVIACRIIGRQGGLWGRCHTLSQYSALAVSQAGRINYACGSGMAVRKDLFDQVGGFNETYQVAEDEELSLRLREKGSWVFFEPKALVYHQRQVRLADLWRLSYRWARLGGVRVYREHVESSDYGSFYVDNPLFFLWGAPIISMLVTLRILARVWRSEPWIMALFPLVLVNKMAWCVGTYRYLKECNAPGRASA